MKKHIPLLVAAAVMLLMHELFSLEPLTRLMQVPSGFIASIFIGAPVEYDGELVRIHSNPELTVSIACSGIRLLSILTGLGCGYWCDRKPLRWVLLLPLCYSAALFSNAARIAISWHFRRIFDNVLPEWLHEFAHVGVGTVWSLTMVAALLYFISRSPNRNKESSL